MKILHVHDKAFAMPVSGSATHGIAEGGGIQVYLSCIAREQLQRGHDLAELRFGDQQGIEADQSEPHRHQARSSSVAPRRSAFEAVERICRRESPDLIHLHSPYYALHPTLLARISRTWPTVLTLHDVTPFCLNGMKLRNDAVLCGMRVGFQCLTDGCFRFGSRSGLAQDLLRAAVSPAKLGAMGKVPVVVVPSRYLRDQALQHGLVAEQLRVLPQFSEYPVCADGSKPAARRILFVGRLVPEKGIGRLIEALATLQTAGWEAAIVGEGPLADAMREKAKHLCGTVHFHGTVSRRDMPGLFAWSNIVVVPSLIPESFGLVGVEAMAFGRPVVAFEAGGVTEWLSHGKTGLFARHGDVADLARQIDRLLVDDALQAAMGRTARREVAARFGIISHVDRLEGFYAEARRCFTGARSATSSGRLAA